MIFIDASAMVALALDEPDAARIAAVIDSGDPMCTSAIAIYEAAMAITRVLGVPFKTSYNEVMLMIRRGAMNIVMLSDVTAYNALVAHHRYGKGRHPAKLNMGDCFAYAAARARNAKILFVGDDFTHTDLESAVRRDDHGNTL
jgi:ribonuclease VapC